LPIAFYFLRNPFTMDSMVGVDEVGRGSLAGPLLVVAARQVSDLPSEVADSKTLIKAKREFLYGLLITACDFGEGWVNCAEIDKNGLTGAMRLGVARALRALGAEIKEEIIMDGPINYLPKKFKNITCMTDADAQVPIVSAASIYAKVTRDHYMAGLMKKYPKYGFENHVGYGTAFHLAAIEQFGAIEKIHRMSFAPLKAVE
jgi:ribonuclease HII